MKLYNFVDFRKLEPCGKLTERSRLFTGYACNIKCKFCFYKDMKHTDIRPLIDQQLALGKAYGIKDWDISGGEPSILPYWFNVLKDMKHMGFRNIACITNGYKFANEEFLKKSMEYGMNEILLSLHGSRIKFHDRMTGVKGSYDHVMGAMLNAQKHDLKTRINVVVTKDNFRDLPDLVSIVHIIGIKPIAFNFLPFRIENSADKENAVKYSEIAPYIMKAIDRLDTEKTKISIRYVPFCLFKGYEKYVAGYLQRVFDEYEWDEYTIRRFEAVRFNKNIPSMDMTTDKWKLQIDALHKSIKHVANHSTTCLRCKYLHVCDGIWKSYAKVWGIDEFKPVEGEKIYRICQ